MVMQFYLLTYARFIVIIAGVRMKILESQGPSDQKTQVPLRKTAPI